MSSKQLAITALVLLAGTLAAAWLIERRWQLTLRQELNAWGTSSSEGIDTT
jgi:hypothetical protein